MTYPITNGIITLSAEEKGAELASVSSVRDGYEYLWQGLELWSGRSPLLFPVVGRLRDDKLKLSGAEYMLQKHGFARKSEFNAVLWSDTSLTFKLTENAETLKSYPFRFELYVTYRLNGSGFRMEYRVVNTDERDMYFSIGAHPGFNCEMGDKVVLDEPETASAFMLNKDGLIEDETLKVFENSSELEITPDVFKHDALIFAHLKSRGCTLRRANGRNVHVAYGDAPCLGLWAKPGAKYVCIEPWYGRDDDTHTDCLFKERPYVQTLPAGGEFGFALDITLD